MKAHMDSEITSMNLVYSKHQRKATKIECQNSVTELSLNIQTDLHHKQD